MEKREFVDIIQKGVGTKAFNVAVIIRTIGFVFGIISSIIAIPKSVNIGSSIIGMVLGNCTTLFLVILPLFEIIKSKNSMNFKNDCDFGLKYIRVNTIIMLVICALLSVVSLLLMVAADIKMIILFIVSVVLVIYSIIQLEIINDLRNALFYNVEKITHAFLYLILTIMFCIASVVLYISTNSFFETIVQLFNSVAQIIFSWLIFQGNKKYLHNKSRDNLK